MKKLSEELAARMLFAHANSQMERQAMVLFRRGMVQTYPEAERLAHQTQGQQVAKVLQQQLRDMGAGVDVRVTCP